MATSHRLLACLVALLWGLNFLAIHASLQAFPPFLTVALRFALIAVPTLLFVKRPPVRWRWLLGYGIGFGVLQFAFLYTAMTAGMPTGVASLVLQASAPFTLLLGALLLREDVHRWQWIGIAGAVLGMALVGVARAQAAQVLPYLLTLCGALGWAGGNLSSRLAKAPNALALTAWMSVVPPLPMLVLSLLTEGPHRDWAALVGSFRSTTGALAWAGLAYTVLLATIVGSGIWSWLLARHNAGRVAPFSMLVPVVGIAASFLVLGERPRWLELVGAAVVVAGVLVGARGAARRPDKPQHPPVPDEVAAAGLPE